MMFCVVVLNLVVLCISSLFAIKEWDSKFFCSIYLPIILLLKITSEVAIALGRKIWPLPKVQGFLLRSIAGLHYSNSTMQEDIKVGLVGKCLETTCKHPCSIWIGSVQ